MPTLFTRIIEGELPATFVWKDPECVAFLSINPIQPGHTLVVPRAEVDHWIDLDPRVMEHVVSVAQTIGQGLDRAFGAPRVGLEIAGFEIPHVHLHVLPIRNEADLHLANSARSVDPDDLAAAGERLRAALRELGAEHVSD